MYNSTTATILEITLVFILLYATSPIVTARNTGKTYPIHPKHPSIASLNVFPTMPQMPKLLKNKNSATDTYDDNQVISYDRTIKMSINAMEKDDLDNYWIKVWAGDGENVRAVKWFKFESFNDTDKTMSINIKPMQKLLKIFIHQTFQTLYVKYLCLKVQILFHIRL